MVEKSKGVRTFTVLKYGTVSESGSGVDTMVSSFVMGMRPGRCRVVLLKLGD